jgi:hypothetical protein
VFVAAEAVDRAQMTHGVALAAGAIVKFGEIAMSLERQRIAFDGALEAPRATKLQMCSHLARITNLSKRYDVSFTELM